MPEQVPREGAPEGGGPAEVPAQRRRGRFRRGGRRVRHGVRPRMRRSQEVEPAPLARDLHRGLAAAGRPVPRSSLP